MCVNTAQLVFWFLFIFSPIHVIIQFFLYWKVEIGSVGDPPRVLFCLRRFHSRKLVVCWYRGTPTLQNKQRVESGDLALLFTFFFIFIYIIFLFVVNFVIHWNEKALGSHVFPIPIPTPTSLPTYRGVIEDFKRKNTKNLRNVYEVCFKNRVFFFARLYWN